MRPRRRRPVPAGEPKPLERGVELAVEQRDELGVDPLADQLLEEWAAGGDRLGDPGLDVDGKRHGHTRINAQATALAIFR